MNLPPNRNYFSLAYFVRVYFSLFLRIRMPRIPFLPPAIDKLPPLCNETSSTIFLPALNKSVFIFQVLYESKHHLFSEVAWLETHERSGYADQHFILFS